MDLKRKAVEIANDMYLKGLQPWHTKNEISNRALPITKSEEESLSKLVTAELYKMQQY